MTVTRIAHDANGETFHDSETGVFTFVTTNPIMAVEFNPNGTADGMDLPSCAICAKPIRADLADDQRALCAECL